MSVRVAGHYKKQDLSEAACNAQLETQPIVCLKKAADGYALQPGEPPTF